MKGKTKKFVIHLLFIGLAAMVIGAGAFFYTMHRALSPAELCSMKHLGVSENGRGMTVQLIEKDCGATSSLSRILSISNMEGDILVEVRVIGSGPFDYCLSDKELKIVSMEHVRLFRLRDININIQILAAKTTSC
jgi:hypothetical protein